jgi:hypothetical protein
VVSMFKSVLIPRMEALARVPLLSARQAYCHSLMLDTILPVNKAVSVSHGTAMVFSPDEIQEHQCRHQVEIDLWSATRFDCTPHLQ